MSEIRGARTRWLEASFLWRDRPPREADPDNANRRPCAPTGGSSTATRATAMKNLLVSCCPVAPAAQYPLVQRTFPAPKPQYQLDRNQAIFGDPVHFHAFHGFVGSISSPSCLHDYRHEGA